MYNFVSPYFFHFLIAIAHMYSKKHLSHGTLARKDKPAEGDAEKSLAKKKHTVKRKKTTGRFDYFINFTFIFISQNTNQA